MKDSVALFKKTWGENAIGQAGMGLVIFLLALLGVLPIALGIWAENTPVLIGLAVVTVVYWVSLSILSSSLSGIFVAALYVYARTGTVPAAFSPELIKNAYAPKSLKPATA